MLEQELDVHSGFGAVRLKPSGLALPPRHQERRLADLLGLQAGVKVVPAGLAAAARAGLPLVAAERPGPLAVRPQRPSSVAASDNEFDS